MIIDGGVSRCERNRLGDSAGFPYTIYTGMGIFYSILFLENSSSFETCLGLVRSLPLARGTGLLSAKDSVLLQAAMVDNQSNM